MFDLLMQVLVSAIAKTGWLIVNSRRFSASGYSQFSYNNNAEFISAHLSTSVNTGHVDALTEFL